jgi:cytochrome c-type biogenesis protein CcmH/NrfG
MKKENLLFLVVALIVGLLVGIIVGNKGGGGDSTASSSSPPSATAPVQNFDQQIKMLKQVVEKEPENRNAWVQLGHNYFDSNQYVQAVEAYDKALELDGNDPNVLTDQGVMFRKLGWYDRAVQNFEKAYALNSLHTQSVYNLGIVYRYDLNDFAKAVEAWEKFLAIAPPGPSTDQVRAEVEFMKTHPPTSGN